MKKKLLVICGPTATGKTSLGIKLAKKFDGEIVSADSRQVYRGMDIGTGKDLPENAKIKSQKSKLQVKSQNDNYQIGYYLFEGVKVWLLDVVEPDYRFSVADFLECAQAVIKDCWRRKKLPVVVGGTGFYIKTLIEGVETVGVKPDLKLRKKLQGLRVAELQKILKGTCPERIRGMNQSDRQNPRRLIRAIEIAKKAKSEKRKVKSDSLKLKAEYSLFLGLKAGYSFLYQKIDRRVERRVKQGIEEEIKALLKQGYDWKNSSLGSTLGYKEWKPLLRSDKYKVISKKLKDEVIQKWKYAEHAYARRQMTWFRRQPEVVWFGITQKNWQKAVERQVKRWYNEK